jgi:hypothetical protein
MAINLESYPFTSPGQSETLHASSGVYAILGKLNDHGAYTVIDVGQSGNVRECVVTRERACVWRRCNWPVFCTAYYCNEADRMKIAGALKAILTSSRAES